MSSLITAIILAKNEEKHIIKCVKSLNFCDEVLIIDDNSTDNTIKSVVKLNNAKVRLIPYSLQDDFSKARNFGLSQAKGEWVLFVDADEIISDALSFEISNAINQLSDESLLRPSGFNIVRKDFMWGKMLNYGESGGMRFLRLAKKDAGEWHGKVHEEWKIKGKVGVLKNYLLHYPHQSVAEFLTEINYYTDIRAQELYLKKIKVRWWSIVVFPAGKLINNLILKRGFLDGERGLIVSLIMSFHSFLVRGKLWLIWNKN